MGKIKKAAKAVKRTVGSIKKANKDVEKALREITANRN